ncbi:MAG TPA: putative toxin-antitoxin system toxin component, PIN family [Bacteroidales bacterium]|jgi:putative PIN family toxin of toxin-antitoxin system|nr:putative toxin-antitoxin system toxin component, PIN family [Bacteroidota bacterium]HHU25042.1 putative toxin-antitoxin system toxin component, PIN family [Bacteroidales bacterium]
MRFVADTNTLVSAILKPLSIPAQALEVAREQGCICFSEKTLAEATEVLSRNKFDKYLPENKRMKQLQQIAKQADFISVEPLSVLACRDPKDNKFLELAVAACASCIITGDKDLLVLHPFRNIPILSPSDFLNTSF